MRFLRYALATFCFAACVGCLALWVWTVADDRLRALTFKSSALSVTTEVAEGVAIVWRSVSLTAPSGFEFESVELDAWGFEVLHEQFERNGAFGRMDGAIHFPLWYPTLIFALAGVGVLRFRRQFSIRSALVAVSVVAALLGMAVVLQLFSGLRIV